MKNAESILEKDYPINSLNIDTSRRLSLYGLLGILQDAAWEHASILGFGYEDAMKKGFFWALIRLRVEMADWPTWHKTLTLRTWTKPVSGIFAIREFEFFIDEEKIGACSSTWVILDSVSRKPKIIGKADLVHQPVTDYSVGFSADKIILPEQMDLLKTFVVEISDLDVNQHANNVKYAQWMLDTLSPDQYQKMKIRGYEINFLSEAFHGDHIEILSDSWQGSTKRKPEVCYQGRRQIDQKNIFAARLF